MSGEKIELPKELTLRDYFAAKASEEDIHQHTIYSPDDDTFSCRTREQARFAYADAMLAARGKQ